MDRPLGRACGNVIEVIEAINALRGEGPDDLMEVTLSLSAEMLLLGGASTTLSEARSTAERALESGRALAKFAEIIEAQGGDPRVVEDTSLLPRAHQQAVFSAPRDGFVRKIEPRTIGRTIVSMGGGRQSLDEVLDLTAGMEFTVKSGDRVSRGDPVATLFGTEIDTINRGLVGVGAAVEIGFEPAEQLPLISHRVSAGGTETLRAVRADDPHGTPRAGDR
jgi:pyrimidine-nucleoside phosphorylase